jgi:aminopeptidase C
VYRVFVDRVNPNSTLQQTKSALDAGDRLTFGVLLFSTNKGTVGAVGKHNATNDSWVLSDDIIEDIKNQGDFGGHEMIITGYDDTAVAIDNAGKTHTGLLTLRNSWGPNIADQGNFYMSYDYFKALIIELQRIRTFR